MKSLTTKRFSLTSMPLRGM